MLFCLFSSFVFGISVLVDGCLKSFGFVFYCLLCGSFAFVVCVLLIDLVVCVCRFGCLYYSIYCLLFSYVFLCWLVGGYGYLFLLLFYSFDCLFVTLVGLF